MAALTVARTGLGATISGTGLVTTQIVSIGGIKISTNELNITTLSTTGFEDLRPGDLRKNPDLPIEFNWLGAAPPLSTAMIPTAEPYAGIAVTVTLPSAGSFQGTAFVKEVEFPSAKQNEIMKGKYVLQFDGATELTFTPA